MAALAEVVAVMIASLAVLATGAGGDIPIVNPTPVVGGGTTPAPADGGSSWCVARSDASDQALQTALDYACGSGADCTPIQTAGLCYLPNTLQAHASYAFNSYFQRRARGPGSCEFAGTANIARTDPSLSLSLYLFPSFPFSFLSNFLFFCFSFCIFFRLWILRLPIFCKVCIPPSLCSLLSFFSLGNPAKTHSKQILFVAGVFFFLCYPPPTYHLIFSPSLRKKKKKKRLRWTP